MSLFIPIKSLEVAVAHGAIRETLLQKNHPRQGHQRQPNLSPARGPCWSPLSALHRCRYPSSSSSRTDRTESPEKVSTRCLKNPPLGIQAFSASNSHHRSGFFIDFSNLMEITLTGNPGTDLGQRIGRLSSLTIILLEREYAYGKTAEEARKPRLSGNNVPKMEPSAFQPSTTVARTKPRGDHSPPESKSLRELGL